jgi:hypothetical protein
MWNVSDPLVGQTVEIYTDDGAPELATVIATHSTRDLIKVRSHIDNETLIGNQWEPAE